jgi:hypothetical protein
VFEVRVHAAHAVGERFAMQGNWHGGNFVLGARHAI